MILVHRLRGEPLFLNPDLVESVAETPDTTLTLIDGRRLIVGETGREVVDAIRTYRASVIVRAEELGGTTPPSLRLVGEDEEVQP